MTTFRKPYLLQRLYPASENKLMSAFAFGGGYKNGGFSDEGFAFVTSILSFDYMGAAEFEFGAVPQAFQTLLREHDNLVTKEVDGIFIISHKDIIDEATKWITAKAKDEYSRDHQTKEYVGINEESSRGICGWIDMYNPLMFFTSESMFEDVKKLFAIE